MSMVSIESPNVDVEAQSHQVTEPPGPAAIAIPSPASVPGAVPQTNSNTSVDSATDSSVLSQRAAATVIDSSDPLFSMYNEMTAGHDRKMAEDWRGDADSAVIVNGLFSVMVAILLGLSYQNASVFYLSQIYRLQLLAVQNGTSTPQIPDSPIFSFSVWTNIAWSLSLVLSLVCTVLATLLRQWARRHLQITREPRGVRSRARVGELVAQGLEMPQLRRMSSILLGLFHLSVGLFLSGFVSSINNNVVFFVTLGVTSICVILYYFISVVPLFSRFHISHTPFSSLVWFCWSRFVWWAYRLLYNSSLRLPFIADHTQQHLWKVARTRLSWTLRDTKVTLEDLAQKHSSSLDISVVSRVYNSLDGHEDMEQFLSAIPGFYNSGKVNKDSSLLEGLGNSKFAPAIVSFMDRSLSSNLFTKPKQRQRIMISLRAMNSDLFLLQSTFRRAIQTLNSDIFRSVDFVGLALEYLHKDDSDPWVKDFAQCILAVAINRVRLDDGAWIDIVDRYLKPYHSHYLREGQDIRLCSFIYLIRRLKVSRLKSSNQFKAGGLWGNVLAEALKFQVMKTAYDLQLEFRDLLDELHSMTLGGVPSSEMTQSNAGLLLSGIRTAFVSHASTAPPAITFSSSTGDPGPVLEWLALNYSQNLQEEVGRADPWAVPDITNIPAPEQPYETQSPPHSGRPSLLPSQHTPFSVLQHIPSPPPHLELSSSSPPARFIPVDVTETTHAQEQPHEIRSQSPHYEQFPAIDSPPHPSMPEPDPSSHFPPVGHSRVLRSRSVGRREWPFGLR